MEEIKKEILISFHSEFSDNQNHHQKLFLQILSVLVTVIIGYGYVYTAGGKLESNSIKPSPVLLSFSLSLASLITSFGLIMLCNMALGYRRDQFVVARIRSKVGVLNNPIQEENVFPRNYDPGVSLSEKYTEYNQRTQNLKWTSILKKLWLWVNLKLSWMPNFHNFLFMILSILQVLLLISFLINPFDDITLFDFTKEIYWPYVISVAFWIIISWFVLERNFSFEKRLKDTYGM